MSEDFFDFGFTAVDENELEVVQKATQTAESASSTAEEMQDKIDKLYNAITPLLNNLKAIDARLRRHKLYPGPAAEAGFTNVIYTKLSTFPSS